MTTIKDYEKYLGKRVYCYVTGLRVQGTVTHVTEDEHAIHVTVNHEDRPVQWGDQTFRVAHLFARKFDGWGSAQNISETE